MILVGRYQEKEVDAILVFDLDFGYNQIYPFIFFVEVRSSS
jgi:hypothetical protein